MKALNSIGKGLCAAALGCMALGLPAQAQSTCGPALLSPTLTALVTEFPGYNASVPLPQQSFAATFIIDVTNEIGNSPYLNPPIPYGLYDAYCVDASDDITATVGTVPGSTVFTGNVYLTCDTNLNKELPGGHPNTMVSPAVWQMVDYLLNETTYDGTNVFYWDMQAAINTLVGNDDSQYGTPVPDGGATGYPAYHSDVVTALLTAASNNAASWKPGCGNYYGVIYTPNPTNNQFLILKVPYPCTPPEIGTCYTNLSDAEADVFAAVQKVTGCEGPISNWQITSSGTKCAVTITATGSDACGNTNVETFNTTIFTAPPKLVNTPPASETYTSTNQVPTAPNVTAVDSCGDSLKVNYSQTESTPTGTCNVIIVRTWSASDCAGQTTTFVQTNTVSQQCVSICTNFCNLNNNCSWLWCNAHLTCNPGKACTIYCQKATITVTCTDGKSYCYPVPDCQVQFTKCSSASCSYDGKTWTTTVPTCGDSQVFLTGCGIPWQSDFAKCKSVCWQGTFSCSTNNVSCSWQWGASCYNNSFADCSSLGIKPCLENPCGYPSGDCAGTPENCKNFCQQSSWGNGGSSYCGSWTGCQSFTCK